MLKASLKDFMNYPHNVRIAAAVVALVCVKLAIAAEAGSGPSRRPTKEQMLAATMPAYAVGANEKQECLGRLVWTTQDGIGWPVAYDRKGNAHFDHMFSENVFSPGDEIHFGNVTISVVALEPGIKDDVIVSLPFARLARLSKELSAMEAALPKLKALKNRSDKDENRYEVAESGIASSKETIAGMKAKYHEFSPGIADSAGYMIAEEESSGSGDKYSIYRAYMFKNDFLYTFESQEKITAAMTLEKHRQQFVTLLKSFRTRKTYEVPTELGVCIPHGFLPDDGRTVTDIKQSLRWRDAPGVLYTIHTGNVQPNQLKSTLVKAAAAAGTGMFGSTEEAQIKPFVKERIGPRQASIGGLRGEQGGVALKISKAGQKPYEAYSVFTGYSGWLGTDVLPYILVDMQTHTKDQAPELKDNPPAFKQSMDRLEALLKNMRLRKTDPEMPELR